MQRIIQLSSAAVQSFEADAVDRVAAIAPAPLLPGEKEADYAQLAARIVGATKPRDTIEGTFDTRRHRPYVGDPSSAPRKGWNIEGLHERGRSRGIGWLRTRRRPEVRLHARARPTGLQGQTQRDPGRLRPFCISRAAPVRTLELSCTQGFRFSSSCRTGCDHNYTISLRYLSFICLKSLVYIVQVLPERREMAGVHLHTISHSCMVQRPSRTRRGG